MFRCANSLHTQDCVPHSVVLPHPNAQQCEGALEPTSLPEHSGGRLKGGRMAGSHTWFESRHAWSCFNIPIEVG